MLCLRRFLLTVEGLHCTVLLLPIWLNERPVENAAEVTCRLQHQ